jgi:hypothetical protein
MAEADVADSVPLFDMIRLGLLSSLIHHPHTRNTYFSDVHAKTANSWAA